MANSVDPAGMAHYVLPHQDQHCLPLCLCWFRGLKGLNQFPVTDLYFPQFILKKNTLEIRPGSRGMDFSASAPPSWTQFLKYCRDSENNKYLMMTS